MNDAFFHKTACDRCGGPLQVRTLSKFNLDVLCSECEEDERLAPGFLAADAAEVASVRSGEMNFPGVGLGPEDQAFLAACRKARRS